MPLAPATFACIISIVIWYLCVSLPSCYISITIALLIIGVVLCRHLVTVWGKDPRQIVVDEYASFLIPLYFTPKRILPLVIAFVLFRLFDILKPPPLRQVEKIPGGWGVMLDDIGAAIYTAIIMLVINIFINL